MLSEMLNAVLKIEAALHQRQGHTVRARPTLMVIDGAVRLSEP